MNLFLQNLLQSLRSLRRTGWQTLVSLIGLVVGLVSLTLSANWLWSETHYDRFRPDYGQLYVPHDTANLGEFSRWMSYKNFADMRNALKGQAEVGVFSDMGWGSNRVMPLGETGNFAVAELLYVDSVFVAVVRPELLAGNFDAFYSSNDKVIITETMATQLFESPEKAIGKTLDSPRDGTATIVAVVADCEKESNIYYDLLRKRVVNANDLQDGNRNFCVLIRTPDIEKTRSLMPELTHINGRTHEAESIVVKLMPLRTMHKYNAANSFLEAFFYPIAFVVISLLLLLSAVVNLIMSVTSIFLGRLREYALRRSFGASAGQNDLWLLTELLPLCGAATMLSALVLEWLAYGGYVPGFADHVFVTFSWVLAGTLAVLLLAMLYPLMCMRLAYRRSFSGLGVGTASHSYLLVVQCFACALLLFLSLGMQRQLSGMINGDLGFERDNLLRLYTGRFDVYGEHNENINYSAFVRNLPAEFKKEVGAGITDALQMRTDIFNHVSKTYTIVVTDDVLERERQSGAENWFEFYFEREENKKYGNFELVELPFRAMAFFGVKTERGVGMSAEAAPGGKWPAMLNRKACESLGLSDPTTSNITLRARSGGSYHMGSGKGENHLNMQPLDVQDIAAVRLTDFHKEESPILFLGVTEDHECSLGMHDAVYIKHEPGRRADAEAAVRRVLTEKFDVASDRIRLTSLQEHIEYTYKDEVYYANLLTAVTVFSVFITFSGVLSLLLYSLRLRRRSMAIHRVMGASFRDLLRATLPPYLVCTLLGGVLAYAPAVYFMKKWMEYFTAGAVPGVEFMALILGSMLLVVLLLTCWQVRRAMCEKPVDVLRPES